MNTVKYVAFQTKVCIRKRICRQTFAYIDLNSGVRTIFHKRYFTINSLKIRRIHNALPSFGLRVYFGQILDVFRTINLRGSKLNFFRTHRPETSRFRTYFYLSNIEYAVFRADFLTYLTTMA